MKLKTFIDRPILSCVISVLILMLGIIGLANLPMEQYPDIAPPTIMVSTTYYGFGYLHRSQCGNGSEERDCSIGGSN